jgi:hypothetical protein
VSGNALTFRVQQDRQKARDVAKSVEDGIAATRDAAKRIRQLAEQMNEIYRERLEGRRRVG